MVNEHFYELVDIYLKKYAEKELTEHEEAVWGKWLLTLKWSEKFLHHSECLIEVYWKVEFGKPLTAAEDIIWDKWRLDNPIEYNLGEICHSLILYAKFEGEKEEAVILFRKQFAKRFPKE